MTEMSEFEKHMTLITLQDALKVFDEKPAKVEVGDVKPLTTEEALAVFNIEESTAVQE